MLVICEWYGFIFPSDVCALHWLIMLLFRYANMGVVRDDHPRATGEGPSASITLGLLLLLLIKYQSLQYKKMYINVRYKQKSSIRLK